MIFYVLIGGMKGTTWAQIVKAVLLIGGAFIMTIWVMALNNFDFSALLNAAVATSITDPANAILCPGLKYSANPLDFVSLSIALVLGTAGLPHVLMRFYTVPSAREARRSVVWAILLIGIFYIFTLVLGYGAAALVGPQTILDAPGGQNSAAPLLVLALGGPVLMGIISTVAFATILAVAASANLPTIVYSLFWHRFNTRGAVWSMVGGLVSTVVLIVCSPVFSGGERSIFPEADFAWFPLSNPGIVSIPLGPQSLHKNYLLSSPAIRCAT